MEFDHFIDCRSLRCPLVLLRTKKKIDTMKVNEVLKIISTDPESPIDLGAWIAVSEHRLIKELEEDHEFTFYIQKTHSLVHPK